MPNAADQVHLNNIITAIQEIDGYVEQMDVNQFSKDEEAQGVVSRNLQMIGEAAYLLTDELKQEYGQIDFEVLVNLKNTWYNVEVERDPRLLWDIIENDLPVIKEDVFAVSEELSDEEDLSE